MIRILILAAAALCAAAAQARPLRVVATLPDAASLAREVGGERASVESLAPPVANPHFVEAKPSFVVKLLRADLFLQNGLELEEGWAPVLLQGARRRQLMPGERGFLNAADAIEPIEVPDPSQLSRAMGDVHPGGNPHFLTDPENARLVARLIAERLSALAPQDAPYFQQRLAAFESRLDAAIGRWKEELAPARGAKFVSYHREWNYFARRFGLIPAGELEPKPGIPPTAAHTAALIARMKEEGIRLILLDPWYERRTPEAVARVTGARVALMAMMPGAVPGTGDYFSAMDHNVRTVAEALR